MNARFTRPLLAALIVAAACGLAVGPVASGSQGAAAAHPGDPLPTCRYADVKTRYRQLSDWKISLLDTERKVTRSYVPGDLVSISRANLPGSGRVRSIIVANLKAMAAASRQAGAGIAVRSAYRSYAQQQATFQGWVNQIGYQRALLASARPGHSEHQLGTTIDFRSANSTRAPWDYPDWATTAAGAWMQEHAWTFGFVMSYPKGKTGVSCYQYEPWHYRYFGRSLAAQIHASHKVPRRYLWTHFESAP